MIPNLRTGATMSLALLLVLLSGAAPWGGANARQIVRGRVVLDTNANGRHDPGEKGLAGVAVSDGVHFAMTGADGSYQLKVQDDPMIPYQPARVISMSWPSGTWPTSRWYRRLADLPRDEPLHFTLRPERQQLPIVLAHGTDPHDNCAGAKSRLWAQEIGRMKEQVRFAVMTGDLGYADPGNAHEMFSGVADYTRKFPIPLFHTIGNHDVVGMHSPDWKKQGELHGNGAYTKFLGPIRWSFSHAGIHFVGLDWALIDPQTGHAEVGVPEVATSWLRQDLLRQAPGTRTFLFLHQPWSPTSAFWDALVEHEVELVMGGHSHRNLDMSQRGITALTTMNLRGPYRLIHISNDRHEIIERCMGCKDPTYHSRHCRLKAPELDTGERRRSHLALGDLRLASGKRAVEPIRGDGLEIVARIEPGRADRCGIILQSSPPSTETVEIACHGTSLSVNGVEIPSVPLPGQTGFDLRVIAAGNRLIVTANLRVMSEKPLRLRPPLHATLFAEKGEAQFQHVHAWGLQ